MEWMDEAIVLSVRPHGETASVVDLLTRSHGRHSGLVHGGRSRKNRPILQIGNQVQAVWKARLADHLGRMTLELKRGTAAAAMDDPPALAALTSLCALTRLLPERDPHPALYEVTLFVMSFLDDPSVWPALYVRWELALLQELGFGIDLSQCAVTGSNDQLIYVSPRTGRAVSASAGEPYRDRLLPLPQFLTRTRTTAVTRQDIESGLKLTGHFLQSRLLTPHGGALPETRNRILAALPRTADPTTPSAR
jgi:DNA repair protein RecO (recombination protein O)